MPPSDSEELAAFVRDEGAVATFLADQRDRAACYEGSPMLKQGNIYPCEDYPLLYARAKLLALLADREAALARVRALCERLLRRTGPHGVTAEFAQQVLDALTVPHAK